MACDGDSSFVFRPSSGREDAMTLTSPVVRLWWWTLGIGAAVVGAVATLLILILAAAKRIDTHAAAIWQTGTSIARNTAAIWQLKETNATAGQILAGTAAIAQTAESIDGHL